MQNGKTVVFVDSGVGGRPYLDVFKDRNPDVQTVYIADSQHYPYGEKTRPELVEILSGLTAKIIDEHNPAVIVLACNTASVTALEELRLLYPDIPFVGTVPAIKPAILASRKKHIGVIGTERTVAETYIDDLARSIEKEYAGRKVTKITKIGAADLVDFVEKKLETASNVEKFNAAEIYVKWFREAGADGIVLGCTHFLFLLDEFKEAAKPDITIYDSLDGVSARIEAILSKNMKGLIISGSRNVFVVKPLTSHNANENYIECRIKGKVLKEDKNFFNPLAPGDIVEYTQTGLIISLKKRRNIFTRFNIKGNVPQILAANIDLAFCITSPASPPFRPRFIDRFLLQAEVCGITPVILCNKHDLLCESSSNYEIIQERLNNYRIIGYKTIFTSVQSGDGLEALQKMLINKTSVFCGQSGVGKSSLLNALLPEACMKVGGMNKKWDRGNHTTVMAHLFESKNNDFTLIDTPGVRNFSIAGVTAKDIINYMPDILGAARDCGFGASCTHRSEEGCGVLKAVKTGAIHPERYQSFIKIFDEVVSNEGELLY
ncbi:hypothetical protein FACS1894190_05710 [Spirochaetia bacterium]|nr:hypothetical protein FACS1894190_05710 [Spirochaetia bacterium]